MKMITDLDSMYPTDRIYRNDDNGFPTYSVKVGRAKREDGTYKNMYDTIKFGADAPEFENATDVVIKNSFVSGKVKTYDDGKEVTYRHIQVTDYEVVGELPFDEETSHIEEVDEDDDWA